VDADAAPDATAAATTPASAATASAATAATAEATVSATAPQSKAVLACLAAAARVSGPLEEAFLATLMAGELELKTMKKKKKRARTAEETAAEGASYEFGLAVNLEGCGQSMVSWHRSLIFLDSHVLADELLDEFSLDSKKKKKKKTKKVRSPQKARGGNKWPFVVFHTRLPHSCRFDLDDLGG
jgi:hypothetical protein